MKWGVRRAQKKQARNDYKTAKKAARTEFKNTVKKMYAKEDSNNRSYREGTTSKYKHTEKQLSYDRAYDNMRAKKNASIAKAKRDYRVAKGMNAEKADKKYKKTTSKLAESLKDADYKRTVELVREDPGIARMLHDKGKINKDDFINASVDVMTEKIAELANRAEARRRR